MRQFADADLASDIRTHRSTSANTQFLWGPNTRALQSCNARRQTAVSHSTLEAEAVSTDEALRRDLLPALPLWEMLLGRALRAEFMKDNQAAVKVCKVAFKNLCTCRVLTESTLPLWRNNSPKAR
eukprot:2319574-Pyramimonas_sp.AAC.1